MIRKLLCWFGFHEWVWKKDTWVIKYENLGMETKIDPCVVWKNKCKHCGRIK